MAINGNLSAANDGEDNIDLLVRAARLYYEEQLTQAEIAQQLKTSRSTVSRLLQEARDRGVVQITINYPWGRDVHLEAQLKSIFHLKEARVLTSTNQTSEEVLQGMGLLAAEYLDQVVGDDIVLGVSYGRSVASTIKQLRPTRKLNMIVVQIIGALGSNNPLIEGPELAREMANAYGAQYRYLYAPLIVEDRRTRELLVQEPNILETLSTGRRASVVLMGIGAVHPGVTGQIWTGYLSERELAWLHNVGAIGHMCAQFFDKQGNILDIEMNMRTIGIGLAALKDIELVIAVAGAKEKAQAILGALRGDYIGALVTDDQAAREVLRLHHQGG